MTCIVGLVEGDRVWMGGDSAALTGYDLFVRAEQKIFKNGPMLMGVCGSRRMAQLLRYALTIPDHDPCVDIDKYLATTFMDAVRECLKTHGCGEKDKDAEQAPGNSAFLVGYRGQLRAVFSDYQTHIPADVYESVGCGGQIAKGALFATDHLNGAERVLKALAAAERCSAGVRGPFHVESI
jgi:hypothetical protein